MGIIDRTKHYLKYLVTDTGEDTATLAKLQIERAERFAKQKVDAPIDATERVVTHAIANDSLRLQAHVAKAAEQVTTALTEPVKATHKTIKEEGIYASQEKAVQGSESIRYINDSMGNVAKAVNNTLLPPAMANMLNTPVEAIYDAIEGTRKHLVSQAVETTVTASHAVNAARDGINNQIEHIVSKIEDGIQTPIVLAEECLVAKTQQISDTAKAVAHNHIEQASDAAKDFSRKKIQAVVDSTHQKIDRVFSPVETIGNKIKPAIDKVKEIANTVIIPGSNNKHIVISAGGGINESQILLPDKSVSTLAPSPQKPSRGR